MLLINKFVTMKRFSYILLLATVVAGLWSCHTTEANYKESYDKAVAASRTGEKGEKYQQELASRMKNNYVVDGDSIRLLRHYFSIVDDKVEIIKNYGVVVAEFKQKFNAQSYRDRLRSEEGLQSYVVYVSKNKTYCVVAQGYDDLSVAATFARNPEKYMKMKILVPKAWVLSRY